jgi:hypothetical protein
MLSLCRASKGRVTGELIGALEVSERWIGEDWVNKRRRALSPDHSVKVGIKLDLDLHIKRDRSLPEDLGVPTIMGQFVLDNLVRGMLDVGYIIPFVHTPQFSVVRSTPVTGINADVLLEEVPCYYGKGP